MEKITLEALLRIRDLAACAVRHPDICAAAELALLELNWRSMMVFSLLFDMQSETYKPFVLWQKFQTALEDCTSEATTLCLLCNPFKELFLSRGGSSSSELTARLPLRLKN